MPIHLHRSRRSLDLSRCIHAVRSSGINDSPLFSFDWSLFGWAEWMTIKCKNWKKRASARVCVYVCVSLSVCFVMCKILFGLSRIGPVFAFVLGFRSRQRVHKRAYRWRHCSLRGTTKVKSVSMCPTPRFLLLMCLHHAKSVCVSVFVSCFCCVAHQSHSVSLYVYVPSYLLLFCAE